MAQDDRHLPHEKSIGELEQVFAFSGAMPTGVTVSEDGRIFVCFPDAGDLENNGIRAIYPDGKMKTIVHDPRVLWPATLSIGADGYLYFIANQLHRQAGFHYGKDMREKPYSLFRVKIDALPAPSK